MMKSSVKHIVLCLLSLCLLLSGCTPTPSQNPTHAEDTLTVTDAQARNVTLPKNPKRVAALLGSFAEVWLLAGGTLCAAAEDAWEDFDLSLSDAVCIGGAHSPNAEALLAAAPDLVIASAATASHIALEETLEHAGIPVVYFDVDNFDDYLHMLKVCTDLTERADLYEQNGLRLSERIEQIKDDYASAPLSDKERTVLLLRASASGVKAKGSRGTVLGEMLSDLGCINIADRDGTLLEDLSVEQVITADPHHIFVVSMGNEEAAVASLDALMAENPAWGTLSAVRDGRLHHMDKTLFNLKPNARWAIAYEELYETLTH